MHQWRTTNYTPVRRPENASGQKCPSMEYITKPMRKQFHYQHCQEEIGLLQRLRLNYDFKCHHKSYSHRSIPCPISSPLAFTIFLCLSFNKYSYLFFLNILNLIYWHYKVRFNNISITVFKGFHPISFMERIIKVLHYHYLAFSYILIVIRVSSMVLLTRVLMLDTKKLIAPSRVSPFLHSNF